MRITIKIKLHEAIALGECLKDCFADGPQCYDSEIARLVDVYNSAIMVDKINKSRYNIYPMRSLSLSLSEAATLYNVWLKQGLSFGPYEYAIFSAVVDSINRQTSTLIHKATYNAQG